MERPNGKAATEFDEPAFVREEKKDKTKEYRGYGDVKDKSLWVKFGLGPLGQIRFNPIVTFIAIVLIWGFVAWCSVAKKDVPFTVWKVWIVDKFTWLYIGSQDAWAVFAIILYFSKYSNVKLGKPDDKPEYNDATWFMMLFACGIGVGLFFFGVAEPLLHYTGANRYSADPTMPDNTLAQTAMNITLYHWGIHGWIVYCMVGLLLALLSYREGLPMTMKSCFYPLIGDKIFGWMGDAIDVLSIITTLFGVCTSLGLGTRQLNAGINFVNPNIPSDDLTIQIIIIWCITAVATCSTVSGVGMGIRRLSELCFMVGMFLMIVVLFLDNTWYILNLYVQSIGFYFQWILQLGFHCDAFEMAGPSDGAEDRGRFLPPDVDSTDGPERWMDWWTMFYWGWWISWCPFVGMFIAKISKGRTIKEFINGTLTAPVIYSFMWLIIFGGVGIKQEREAAGASLCCPAKGEAFFLNTTVVNQTLYERGDIEFEDLIVAESSYWLCETGDCGSCAMSTLKRLEKTNATYGDLNDEYQELGKLFGSTFRDRSRSRLSCHQLEHMWFDVMYSYGDVGRFLAYFSFFGIVLYFVTSSDSGSLVIDCLSANGDPDPPKIQRVFWALTEGATATALLAIGGKDGLDALQTAGLVSGLPYTFVCCLICVSIWRAVKVAAGDLDPNGPSFAISLFDPFFTDPMTEKIKPGTFKLFLGFIKNIFLAPMAIAKTAERLSSSKKKFPTAVYSIAPWICFIFFILFHLLELAFGGSWAIGWFFYVCFTTIIAAYRIQIRERFSIVGNPFEDFFSALIFYPCAALQLELTSEWLESDRTQPKRDVEMARPKEQDGKDNPSYASEP